MILEVPELTNIEELTHGDVIRVVSSEQNCGIEKGVFTMLVVDSKKDGLIAIPQDFIGWIGRCVEAGVCWEISIEWLLEQNVEIYLLESYEQTFHQLFSSFEQESDVVE
ncbi:conjugal transfer protein TraF [Enterococcus hirae]|nr:conjugal transfer protein TraF [Enterococcus hirae]